MNTDNHYWKQREFIVELIDHLPSAIFWKDTASVFLGCNKMFSDLAGLDSPQKIVGKTDFDLPWGEFQGAAYRKDDREIIQSKQPKLSIEEPQTLADGTEIILLTSKIPLLSQDGEIMGILGIFHDITERKKMEQSLARAKELAEAANHAKTEFIANMGHDIRTPLTGVIGLSQSLEAELLDPKHKQFAKIIHESGNQLLNLLNGILDVISADNANEHDIHNETFDLRQCIQDITELERPSTQQKELDLHVDIDVNIPTYIVSDRTKLHRIILNLLGNSIKFTHSGEVRIGVKLLENVGDCITLRFTVKDTGIGISAEQQGKIFDRFFRINPSYQGLCNGHGIGLHIVQSYVSLLGGNIQVASNEGVGTTFSFDLSFEIGKPEDVVLHIKHRLQKKQTSTINEKILIQSELTTATITNEKPQVLIVEDNPAALIVAEDLVKRVQLRYITAINGASALELAKTHDLDLIITDLGLPDISGSDLTRQIRAWEIAQHKKPVPIVGLSAHARDNILDKCLPYGMNDGFNKPMTLSTMQTLKDTYISSKNNEHTSSLLSSKLGFDLPDAEEQLFELDSFSLLDMDRALLYMDINLAGTMFLSMINQAIPSDEIELQNAHAAGHWEHIEKLAHKMKGGALYCGMTKMQYACQYLERYRKAGYSAQLEALYQQLLSVLRETKQAIADWLSKNW